MEEGFPNQERHDAEQIQQAAAEQQQQDFVEVTINGQAYRRTVLPAFTREDAVRKHRTMMRTFMNDTRYVRERDGSVDIDVQERYYES